LPLEPYTDKILSVRGGGGPGSWTFLCVDTSYRHAEDLPGIQIVAELLGDGEDNKLQLYLRDGNKPSPVKYVTCAEGMGKVGVSHLKPTPDFWILGLSASKDARIVVRAQLDDVTTHRGGDAFDFLPSPSMKKMHRESSQPRTIGSPTSPVSPGLSKKEGGVSPWGPNMHFKPPRLEVEAADEPQYVVSSFLLQLDLVTDMTLATGAVIKPDYPNPGFPNPAREDFSKELVNDIAIAMQVDASRVTVVGINGLPEFLVTDPKDPRCGEKQQLIIKWRLDANVEPAAAPVNMQMSFFNELLNDSDVVAADEALKVACTEDTLESANQMLEAAVSNNALWGGKWTKHINREWTMGNEGVDYGPDKPVLTPGRFKDKAAGPGKGADAEVELDPDWALLTILLMVDPDPLTDMATGTFSSARLAFNAMIPVELASVMEMLTTEDTSWIQPGSGLTETNMRFESKCFEILEVRDYFGKTMIDLKVHRSTIPIYAVLGASPPQTIPKLKPAIDAMHKRVFLDKEPITEFTVKNEKKASEFLSKMDPDFEIKVAYAGEIGYADIRMQMYEVDVKTIKAMRLEREEFERLFIEELAILLKDTGLTRDRLQVQSIEEGPIIVTCRISKSARYIQGDKVSSVVHAIGVLREILTNPLSTMFKDPRFQVIKRADRLYEIDVAYGRMVTEMHWMWWKKIERRYGDPISGDRLYAKSAKLKLLFDVEPGTQDFSNELKRELCQVMMVGSSLVTNNSIYERKECQPAKFKLEEIMISVECQIIDGTEASFDVVLSRGSDSSPPVHVLCEIIEDLWCRNPSPEALAADPLKSFQMLSNRRSTEEGLTVTMGEAAALKSVEDDEKLLVKADDTEVDTKIHFANATIKLNIDYNDPDFSLKDRLNREQFMEELQEDLSILLDIDINAIKVVTIKAGSVIADCILRELSDSTKTVIEICDGLKDFITDDNSILYSSGRFTWLHKADKTFEPQCELASPGERELEDFQASTVTVDEYKKRKAMTKRLSEAFSAVDDDGDQYLATFDIKKNYRSVVKMMTGTTCEIDGVIWEVSEVFREDPEVKHERVQNFFSKMLEQGWRAVTLLEWPEIWERSLEAALSDLDGDGTDIDLTVDENGIPYNNVDLMLLADGTTERECYQGEVRYFLLDVSRFRDAGKPAPDLSVSLSLHESTLEGTGVWMAWKRQGKPTEKDNQGFTSPDKPTCIGANGHDKRRFQLRQQNPEPGKWVVAVGCKPEFKIKFTISNDKLREAYMAANSMTAASSKKTNILGMDRRDLSHALFEAVDGSLNGFIDLPEWMTLVVDRLGLTEDAAIKEFNNFTWEDDMELTLTQFYRWTDSHFNTLNAAEFKTKVQCLTEECKLIQGLTGVPSDVSFKMYLNINCIGPDGKLVVRGLEQRGYPGGLFETEIIEDIAAALPGIDTARIKLQKVAEMEILIKQINPTRSGEPSKDERVKRIEVVVKIDKRAEGSKDYDTITTAAMMKIAANPKNKNSSLAKGTTGRSACQTKDMDRKIPMEITFGGVEDRKKDLASKFTDEPLLPVLWAELVLRVRGATKDPHFERDFARNLADCLVVPGDTVTIKSCSESEGDTDQVVVAIHHPLNVPGATTVNESIKKIREEWVNPDSTALIGAWMKARVHDIPVAIRLGPENTRKQDQPAVMSMQMTLNQEYAVLNREGEMDAFIQEFKGELSTLLVVEAALISVDSVQPLDAAIEVKFRIVARKGAPPVAASAERLQGLLQNPASSLYKATKVLQNVCDSVKDGVAVPVNLKRFKAGIWLGEPKRLPNPLDVEQGKTPDAPLCDIELGLRMDEAIIRDATMRADFEATFAKEVGYALDVQHDDSCIFVVPYSLMKTFSTESKDTATLTIRISKPKDLGTKTHHVVVLVEQLRGMIKDPESEIYAVQAQPTLACSHIDHRVEPDADYAEPEGEGPVVMESPPVSPQGKKKGTPRNATPRTARGHNPSGKVVRDPEMAPGMFITFAMHVDFGPEHMKEYIADGQFIDQAAFVEDFRAELVDALNFSCARAPNLPDGGQSAARDILSLEGNGDMAMAGIDYGTPPDRIDRRSIKCIGCIVTDVDKATLRFKLVTPAMKPTICVEKFKKIPELMDKQKLEMKGGLMKMRMGDPRAYASKMVMNPESITASEPTEESEPVTVEVNGSDVKVKRNYIDVKFQINVNPDQVKPGRARKDFEAGLISDLSEPTILDLSHDPNSLKIVKLEISAGDPKIADCTLRIFNPQAKDGTITAILTELTEMTKLALANGKSKWPRGAKEGEEHTSLIMVKLVENDSTGDIGEIARKHLSFLDCNRTLIDRPDPVTGELTDEEKAAPKERILENEMHPAWVDVNIAIFIDAKDIESSVKKEAFTDQFDEEIGALMDIAHDPDCVVIKSLKSSLKDSAMMTVRLCQPRAKAGSVEEQCLVSRKLVQILCAYVKDRKSDWYKPDQEVTKLTNPNFRPQYAYEPCEELEPDLIIEQIHGPKPMRKGLMYVDITTKLDVPAEKVALGAARDDFLRKFQNELVCCLNLQVQPEPLPPMVKILKVEILEKDKVEFVMIDFRLLCYQGYIDSLSPFEICEGRCQREIASLLEVPATSIKLEHASGGKGAHSGLTLELARTEIAFKIGRADGAPEPIESYQKLTRLLLQDDAAVYTDPIKYPIASKLLIGPHPHPNAAHPHHTIKPYISVSFSRKEDNLVEAVAVFDWEPLRTVPTLYFEDFVGKLQAWWFESPGPLDIESSGKGGEPMEYPLLSKRFHTAQESYQIVLPKAKAKAKHHDSAVLTLLLDIRWEEVNREEFKYKESLEKELMATHRFLFWDDCGKVGLGDAPNAVDVKIYPVGLLAPAVQDPEKADVRHALENLYAMMDRRAASEFYEEVDGKPQYEILSTIDTAFEIRAKPGPPEAEAVHVDSTLTLALPPVYAQEGSQQRKQLEAELVADLVEVFVPVGVDADQMRIRDIKADLSGKVEVHIRIGKGREGMPPLADAFHYLSVELAKVGTDAATVAMNESAMLQQGTIGEIEVGPLETEDAMQTALLWNQPSLHVTLEVTGEALHGLNGEAISDSLSVYLTDILQQQSNGDTDEGDDTVHTNHVRTSKIEASSKGPNFREVTLDVVHSDITILEHECRGLKRFGSIGGKAMGGCKVLNVLKIRRDDVPEEVAEVFDLLDHNKNGEVTIEDLQKEFAGIMERNGTADKLGKDKMPAFMRVFRMVKSYRESSLNVLNLFMFWAMWARLQLLLFPAVPVEKGKLTLLPILDCNPTAELSSLFQYPDGRAQLKQGEEFQYFCVPVWDGCTEIKIMLTQHKGAHGLEIYLRENDAPTHGVFTKRVIGPNATTASGLVAYELSLKQPEETEYYIGVGGVHVFPWSMSVTLLGQRRHYAPPMLLSEWSGLENWAKSPPQRRAATLLAPARRDQAHVIFMTMDAKKLGSLILDDYLELITGVDEALVKCDKKFDVVPEPVQPLFGDMRIKLKGVVHADDFFIGETKVNGLLSELMKLLGFTEEDKITLRTEDSKAAIRVNSVKVGERYKGAGGELQEKLRYEEVVVDYHIERPKGNDDKMWVPNLLKKLRDLLADRPVRGEPRRGIYDESEYKFLCRAEFEGPELWVVNGPLVGIGDEKYLPYADVKIGMFGLIRKSEVRADLRELLKMSVEEAEELLPLQHRGEDCLNIRVGETPSEAYIDFRLKRPESLELQAKYPIIETLDNMFDMWEDHESDLYKGKLLYMTVRDVEPIWSYAAPEEDDEALTMDELEMIERAPYADSTVKIFLDPELVGEGTEKRQEFFGEIAQELEQFMGIEPLRKGDEVFMLTNLRDAGRVLEEHEPAVFVDFRVAKGKHKGAELPLHEIMGKLGGLCVKFNKNCHLKLGIKYKRDAGDDDMVLAVLTDEDGADADTDEYFRKRFTYEMGRLIKAEEATVNQVVRVTGVKDEGGSVRVNFEIHKSPAFGNEGVLSVEATCEMINSKVQLGEGSLYYDTDTFKYLSKLDKEHHVTGDASLAIPALPCEILDPFKDYKWLKRADNVFEPPITYGEPPPDAQATPKYADVHLAFQLRQSQIRPGQDNEKDFKKSFIEEMSSALGTDSSTIQIKEILRMKVNDSDSQVFKEKVVTLDPSEEQREELSPKTCERSVVVFRLTESSSLLGPKVPETMYRLRRMVKDTRSPIYKRSKDNKDTDACSKVDPAIKPDIKVWEMNTAEAAAFKTGVHTDGAVTLMRFFRCFTMMYGELTDEAFSAKMLDFKGAAQHIISERKKEAALEELKAGT